MEQQPTAPLPTTPGATVTEEYVELLREQARTAEAAAVEAKNR